MLPLSWEWFEVILVSEEVGVKKPDPSIFEMAMDRLKLRPDKCVYVGDRPRDDIEGARAMNGQTPERKKQKSGNRGRKIHIASRRSLRGYR